MECLDKYPLGKRKEISKPGNSTESSDQGNWKKQNIKNIGIYLNYQKKVHMY